ncbi:MAG: hypothetical protein IJQ39_13670 [Thermoguttaceae bacterium]|nr:hypothetical protein [Thermoguttaceae bacterium]
MYTTLSAARRFHVVSFVLTLVCFAALLSRQNAAMGQNASGEKTAVAADADVGENSPGGQEEGTAENLSDQSDSEKDKQTDSNSQENAAKSAADKEKQNKDQNADNEKSEQDKSSLGQKTWNCISSFWEYMKTFFYDYWGTVLMLIASIWYTKYLKPKIRLYIFEKHSNDLNEYKELALECIRLGISSKESDKPETFDISENIDFISHEQVDEIIQHIFRKYLGQESEKEKKSWWGFLVKIAGFFSAKKYIQLSKLDSYLLIITSKYIDEQESDILIQHKKAICEIYRQRYRDYWRHWFKNITLWSIIILILPHVLPVIKPYLQFYFGFNI